jgi:yeast amino acid transporter
MLTVPVVLAFWAVGYLWKRQGGLKLNQIDVDTGRRAVDWEYVHARRAKVASWPAWRRVIDKIW